MVPSASDAWRIALQDLRETLPEQTVRNWLDPIDPLSLDTEAGTPTLRLQVPTPFGIQYLRSRFHREIAHAVTEAVGEPTDVFLRNAECSRAVLLAERRVHVEPREQQRDAGREPRAR
jgi:chromosomal replication initiation ATPase DnaA